MLRFPHFTLYILHKEVECLVRLDCDKLSKYTWTTTKISVQRDIIKTIATDNW